MSKDFIPITLKGNQYKFRFDFNSLCALEEEFGITLAEFDKVFGGPGKDRKLKMQNLRILVWAALLPENENLTITGAGALIDPTKMVEITEKVTEAILLSLPKTEVGEGKNEQGLKSKKSGPGKTT